MTREFRLVRAGKCPTSSMGGGSLALLLEPRCLKFRGELTNFQAVCSLELQSLGVEPSPPWGASPFILQGGAPCLHISIKVSWFRPGVLHLRQLVGPARSVGSGETCVRSVFLGNWLSSCCLVSGQSEWLRHSVGHLLSCLSVWAPPSVSSLHVLSYVASDEGWHAC